MRDLNPVTVVVVIVGAIMMYAAVKNRDPRDIVKEALGQKVVPPAPKPHGPQEFNSPNDAVIVSV